MAGCHLTKRESHLGAAMPLKAWHLSPRSEYQEFWAHVLSRQSGLLYISQKFSLFTLRGLPTAEVVQILLSAVSHFPAGSGHRHLRTLNVWPRGHPRDPSKTVWLPGLSCP